MKTILKTIIALVCSIFFFLVVNVNAQEEGQWEILNEGIDGQLGTIDFVNADVGWISLGQVPILSDLLKTEDGGETWNSIQLDENLSIGHIDFINESVGWAVGSDVDLSIYNILGEKVTNLVAEKQKAGYHRVEWDASGFASGVYLYRLSVKGKSHSFVNTKKLVVLK